MPSMNNDMFTLETLPLSEVRQFLGIPHKVYYQYFWLGNRLYTGSMSKIRHKDYDMTEYIMSDEFMTGRLELLEKVNNEIRIAQDLLAAANELLVREMPDPYQQCLDDLKQYALKLRDEIETHDSHEWWYWKFAISIIMQWVQGKRPQ